MFHPSRHCTLRSLIGTEPHCAWTCALRHLLPSHAAVPPPCHLYEPGIDRFGPKAPALRLFIARAEVGAFPPRSTVLICRNPSKYPRNESDL